MHKGNKLDSFTLIKERYGLLPAVVLAAIPLVILLAVLVFMNYRVAALGGRWDITDFTMMWLGGRGLLDGIDLYDPVQWQALHELYTPEYVDNPIFLYLMPAAFLFAPFALFPVGVGAALWLLLNEMMLFVVVGYFLRRLSVRRPLALAGFFLMLAFFLPVPIIIVAGQYSIIMLFLLWAMYVLMKGGRDGWAGVCLTLMLLRPNPFVLFLPVFLAWVLWKRRWYVLAGSGVSGLLLLGITWLMRPGWPGVWIEYVVGGGGKLYDYGPITPTLWGIVSDLASGLSLSGQSLLSAALSLVCVAVVLWWALRKQSLALDAVLAISTALSLFVTPYAWNYDQILLLFSVLYALVLAEKLEPAQRRWVWGASVFVLLAFPYLMRYIAFQRDTDTFSGFVSLVALLFVLWVIYQKPEQAHQQVL